MRVKHRDGRPTRGPHNIPNVWSTLRDVALSDWGSTVRLGVLLAIKYSPTLILLLMRR